ncbi:LysR family transcriptional regulator [Bradyrhizobium erythrophlei]|uniref:LysR family transcriptional regulator n=1 Tax=Bradyrhizobium erythrophlei TaxID=1437360 RepID=UPI0035EC230E
MDVSVRQLRSFVAVAKLRSFTRAAATLHVSQPTLTVQIKRLEETLRLRLFDRNPRSVELTRMGRELLPSLERMLRDLDTVLMDTRDVAAERRGVVRIAALPSFAAGVLPDAIKAFREDHPGVSFVLKDIIASRVLAAVRSEDVDLGFVGGDASFPDIETIFAARDDMMVVYPRGHPISSAAKVTAQALAGYPLVLMDRETSVRAVTDAAFNRAGLIATPASEATYMMTAVGMVRAGIGIAILPASAREVRAEPSLRSRKINDANFSRPVALIKRVGRTLPPLSHAFADFLLTRRKTILSQSGALPARI